MKQKHSTSQKTKEKRPTPNAKKKTTAKKVRKIKKKPEAAAKKPVSAAKKKTSSTKKKSAAKKVTTRKAAPTRTPARVPARKNPSGRKASSPAPGVSGSQPPITKNNDTRLPFPVVAVGASAGGLEALEKFFNNLPAHPECAIIVITHMDPHHKSLLSELLTKYTDMPVYDVEDGMSVSPDTVYVIPPNRDMSIKNGRLKLHTPSSPRGIRLPIDFFFRSLAEDQYDNAICIILSGTGTDGTLGLKEIKGAGGMAMTQEAESAKYSGMPQSALATGMVDFVLPVESIPQALLKYIERATTARSDGTRFAPVDQEVPAVKHILKHVHLQTGHDFSSYKMSTILRRIEKRYLVNNIDSLEEYEHFLEQNPRESKALFKDLLIGVTNFFRDPEAFIALKNEVLPKLFMSKQDDEPLRIWVPGCSTGEEAYSIAIIVREIMRKYKVAKEVQIFATDIDADAIEYARKGIYPVSAAADISSERINAFFKQKDEHLFVSSTIREMIVFAPHNLLKDPPFFKMDLISCRNLLIYLGAEVQKKIIPLFFYAMNPGGYIFLGPSETIGGFTDIFQAVNQKWKLYKRNDYASPGQVDFPVASRRMPPAYETTRTGVVEENKEPSIDQANFASIMKDQLVKIYGHPAVILKKDFEILHYFGNTAEFLGLPEGKPTNNILKLAREGLRQRLRAVLQKSIKTNNPIYFPNLKYGDTDPGAVNLHVYPIVQEGVPEGLFLVAFEKVDKKKEAVIVSDKLEKDTVIMQLEEELRITSEQLQDTIEKLETSNEELKSSNEELMSMNEELQSTNEELETSKEELQALNEELTTVNSELSNKVDELQEANSNIQNFLESTNVATIFLDKNLTIRLFTPTATELFDLIRSDVGRPLSHISNRFAYKDIIKDCKNVLSTLKPIEQHLRAVDRNYIVRIMPYRTVEDVIDGIVLSFIDITELTNAEQAILESEYKYRTIIDNAGVGVALYDLEGNLLLINQTGAGSMNVEPKNIIGKNIGEFAEEEATMLLKRIKEVARKDKAIQYEVFLPGKGDGRWYLSMYQPLRNRDGNIMGVQIASHDITEMKRAEDLLKRSEEKYRGLFENMLNALALLRAIYDEQGNLVDFEYVEVNKNFEHIYGLKPAEVVGKSIHKLDPEDRIIPQIEKFGTAVKTGKPVEFEWFSKSVNRWHMFSAYRSKKDHLVVLIDDITRRKKMEEGLRKSLDEKDTLIREINHRVKNNFLTVYSLLRFQARQFEDKKLQEAFHESQNRVHVMSLIHDRLSKKDNGKSVSVKDYIEPLARQLVDSYCVGAKTVSSQIDIDSFLLDIDTAIPVGLIINELISNAFKHGLNEVDQGEIHLSVKSHKDGLCTISVMDNGKGLPENFDIENTTSLGFELVRTLVEQLDGKILIKRDNGTAFIIEFMSPMYCV